MKKIIHLLMAAILTFAVISCSKSQQKKVTTNHNMNDKIVKSDTEWKKELTPEEYHIMREKGTEAAFTGDLWDNHKNGMYVCAACQKKLFSSKAKFESGTGWPSFFEPIDEDNVAIQKDSSLGMVREEVVCARCGGHLGHVFADGPEPTGLRYCLNSAALDFVPKDKE